MLLCAFFALPTEYRIANLARQIKKCFGFGQNVDHLFDLLLGFFCELLLVSYLFRDDEKIWNSSVYSGNIEPLTNYLIKDNFYAENIEL